MKLLIIPIIIQLALGAKNVLFSNNHDTISFITRSNFPTPIYDQFSTCDNKAITIGGPNISFDNSCKALVISLNSVKNSSSNYWYLVRYSYDVTLIMLIILSF
jgi:hypothetical protein